MLNLFKSLRESQTSVIVVAVALAFVVAGMVAVVSLIRDGGRAQGKLEAQTEGLQHVQEITEARRRVADCYRRGLVFDDATGKCPVQPAGK